jgi:hypothetical protein
MFRPFGDAGVDKPSQRVVAFNSSTQQTHILINGAGHGEPLAPGERREMRLTCEYIENLRRQRDPSRVDELGLPKPLHPVILLDVPQVEAAAE